MRGGRQFREDVAPQDPARRGAAGPGGGDVVEGPDLQHGAPAEPGAEGHLGDPDGDHGIEQAGAEDGDDDDGEEKGWERDQDVHEARGGAVGPAGG